MDTPPAFPARYNILLVVVLLSKSVLSIPLPRALSSRPTHLHRVDSAPRLDLFPEPLNQSNQFYQFDGFSGEKLYLNLTRSPEWISGEISVEVVRGDSSSSIHTPQAGSSCHFVGQVHHAAAEAGKKIHVQDGVGLGEEIQGSWAALSGCDGQLSGVVAVDGEHYFIEPATSSDHTLNQRKQAHTLTKTSPTAHLPGQRCSTQTPGKAWESGRRSGRGSSNGRRQRRSVVSREYFMEVAVVTEPDMLRTRTLRDLEAYIFSLMNIVSHLYRDSSVGHSLRMALLRVIIMDSNQTNILTGNSADHPLVQFCSWMDRYDKSRGLKEDVAVLLTKQGMCDSTNDECNVLGMADIGTACLRGYSCTIVRDHGLSSSFSMAHELGHTLMMEHDGQPGSCPSEESYIMAASFTESSNPHIWSQCSRNSLSSFLESSQSSCLENRPPSSAELFEVSGATVSLPGFQYSVTEQCQLSLGLNASSCSSAAKSDCMELWCRPGNQSTCISLATPPALGTECVFENGTGMGICYKGNCVHHSSVISPVEGGWGQWAEWSNCSLSCGNTGLQSRSRRCDSPVPRFGGHYCVGKRKEFRTCNKEACPANYTHRQFHCEAYPPMPGHNSWTAVSLDHVVSLGLDVCKSHCSPGPSSSDGIIYTSSRVSLPDGTPCRSDQSKGVCLEGACEPMGCDKKLWTEWSLDECGVWCGDGSTCLRVATTHSPPIEATRGHQYYKALKIPSGSTHIHVSEATPSPVNYVAVKGQASGKFINGNFYIFYSGLTNFTLAGSSWQYSRIQSNGAEELKTDGPIKEDILIYILASATYEGISYSFYVPKSKLDSLTYTVYFWNTSTWKSCDSLCGRGNHTRTVVCSSLSPGGVLERADKDSLCAIPQPASVMECKVECGYSWMASEWSGCNATCNGMGIKTRRVSCQKRRGGVVVGLVADHHCGSYPPSSWQTCRGEVCQYGWKVGPWEECECGGWRKRDVSCVLLVGGGSLEVGSHHCENSSKPLTKGKCISSNAGNCGDFQWQASQWSKCMGRCDGVGYQVRRIVCSHSNGTLVEPRFCSQENFPMAYQTCVNICAVK